MSHQLQLRDKVLKLAASERLVDYARLFSHRGERFQASDFHRFLCGLLQDVAQGKRRRLILTCPPRHGKSRLTSLELPTWMMGRNPTLQIVLASYAESLASDWSVSARERISDPHFRLVFPDVELSPYQQTKTNWKTTAGGEFKAVGVGGALTGRGADLIVIDDPFKDYEEAHSEVVREGVWNWFWSVAYTRLSVEGAVVIIMTRWHIDDLVGRLLDPNRLAKEAVGEKWEVINLPALADPSDSEPDPMSRNKEEALWPERWTAEKLKVIRATNLPYIFSAMYQGRPVMKGGKYINVANFIVVQKESVPGGLRWVRFWDVATTEKKMSDYTASPKMAIDSQGNVWIRDMIHGRWEWPKARDIIHTTGRAEGILVGVESGGTQTGTAQNLREVVKSDFAIHEVVPEKDKLTRALPWIVKVHNKQVFLVAGDWIAPFLMEAEAFPAAPHDDRIDGVSGAHLMLTEGRRIFAL